MGFYPPHVLTNDAKRHDMEVLRPRHQRQPRRCTVEPAETGRGAVRVGLGYVRGVGKAGGAAVERARAHGPSGEEFRSLFDFVQRTGLSRERPRT